MIGDCGYGLPGFWEARRKKYAAKMLSRPTSSLYDHLKVNCSEIVLDIH